MSTFHEFFSHLYHFQDLIRWGGLTVLIVIVFAETGLLAGFFLPGDSLLVTAGLLCALDGQLNFYSMLFSLCAAAVIGDTVGYFIGHKIGRRLFEKEDSLLFKKEYLRRTEAFYAKYGNKTIVIARFVPIVRTFAPTVAGVAGMNYGHFITYNVIGGIAWVTSMLAGGYFLGSHIPHIEKKIHWIILIVIFVSFLPILKEYLSARKENQRLTK